MTYACVLPELLSDLRGALLGLMATCTIREQLWQVLDHEHILSLDGVINESIFPGPWYQTNRY